MNSLMLWGLSDLVRFRCFRVGGLRFVRIGNLHFSFCIARNDNYWLNRLESATETELGQ